MRENNRLFAELCGSGPAEIIASVPMRLCGLIGLQITDFNHKEHKDHKGLAKVNPVLDSPIILWCGLCVLCGLWLFAEFIWVRYGSGYRLCSSVVGSEHSGSPQGQKDTENLRFESNHTT